MAAPAAARSAVARTAGTVAAAAGRPGPARPSGFALSLATPADEPEIRALLRTSVFPGDVRLSLEREPSPLAAAAIEGDVHHLIVARDRSSGALSGIAARSERRLYVNGNTMRAGYLGQLRVAPSCRRLRSLLDEGFAFLRALHAAGAASFYLASLVAGNEPARRLLVRRRSPTAPRFVPAGRLRTFAVSLTRPRPAPPVAGIRLQAGSDALLEQIALCLDRNLRRYQFASCWTPDDLRSDRCRGLAPDDFVVALRGGRVVGCAARWDQGAFKQVVVRGYSARLARRRPLLNLAGRWLDVPALPPPGAPLRFAYLSHVAVDDDREDVMTALVAEQCRHARRAGLGSVVTAFVAEHPFFRVLERRFRHRAYDSELYLAFWPDGERVVRGCDGRIPQPDVAVL